MKPFLTQQFHCKLSSNIAPHSAAGHKTRAEAAAYCDNASWTSGLMKRSQQDMPSV